MSKASTSELEGIGFSASQFGYAAGAEWTAYLQAVLDDQSLEVREQAGVSVYDAATAGTLTEKRLRFAELYLGAAELTRRLEVFERASASKARGDAAETVSSRLLKTAVEFEDRAYFELGLVCGSSLKAGLSQGVVETGPFNSTVS